MVCTMNLHSMETKKEWYLDAYKKFENRCISMTELENTK